MDQLIELLTHYGPVFSVWLDGACGDVQATAFRHGIAGVEGKVEQGAFELPRVDQGMHGAAG